MKAKIQEKIKKLPDTMGVYFFLGLPKRSEGGSGEILYIGKATSLRNRVRSYFATNIGEKRNPLITKMVLEARNVKYIETGSVIEALILEANLIKKYTPPYNTAEKDQKSWNYVVITKEDFPRVLVIRERELKLKAKNLKINDSYGPFTNGSELKEALKIIRRIFPFRDKCRPLVLPKRSEGGCFNYQIGLCPGVCVGTISKKEYANTIKHIEIFFEGKKKVLLKSLEKEMKIYARAKEFEKASEIKHKIFALRHIRDVALLKSNKTWNVGHPKFRIEAYDIAHISGTSVFGVMAVIEDRELKKNDYRKFKVSKEKNNDIAALREVIGRRLNHSEWPYPDLIVVDGGKAQINIAKAELENKGLDIPVAAVLKDERHRPKEIIGDQFLGREKEIMISNSEAHRFAIKYHRKIRFKL